MDGSYGSVARYRYAVLNCILVVCFAAVRVCLTCLEVYWDIECRDRYVTGFLPARTSMQHPAAGYSSMLAPGLMCVPVWDRMNAQ
jgi:hypothetical protein